MARLPRLLLVALCCTSLPVAAQLLSPGKLARGHAQLEGVGNCTKCHAAGEQVAADRCLACHDQLAARIRAALGSAAVGTRRQVPGQAPVETDAPSLGARS